MTLLTSSSTSPTTSPLNTSQDIKYYFSSVTITCALLIIIAVVLIFVFIGLVLRIKKKSQTILVRVNTDQYPDVSNIKLQQNE